MAQNGVPITSEEVDAYINSKEFDATNENAEFSSVGITSDEAADYVKQNIDPSFTPAEIQDVFPVDSVKPTFSRKQKEYQEWLKPRSNALYLQSKNMGYVSEVDTADYEMEEARPEDKSWFKDMSESFWRSAQDTAVNLVSNPYTDFMLAPGEKEGMKRFRQYRGEENIKQKTSGYGYVGDTIMEVVGMVPYMGGGIAASALGGPAAAMAFYSIAGAGEIYNDLEELGIDEETARYVSMVGGLAYGAVEYSQALRAFPGAKKLAASKVVQWVKKHGKSKLMKAVKKQIQRKMTRAALKIGGKKGARVTAGMGKFAALGIGEASQEATQEAITIASEHVGAAFSNLKNDTELLKDQSFMADIAERVPETFVQSLSPLALMAGFGHGAYKFQKYIDKKRRTVKLQKRQELVSSAQNNLNSFQETYGDEQAENLMNLVENEQVSLRKVANLSPDKLNSLVSRSVAANNGQPIDLLTGEAINKAEPREDIGSEWNQELEPEMEIDELAGPQRPEPDIGATMEQEAIDEPVITPETPLEELSPELAQEFDESPIDITDEVTEDEEIEYSPLESDLESESIEGFEDVSALPAVEKMSDDDLENERDKLHAVIDNNPGHALGEDWLDRFDVTTDEIMNRIVTAESAEQEIKDDIPAELDEVVEPLSEKEPDAIDIKLQGVSDRYGIEIERVDIGDDEDSKKLKSIADTYKAPVTFVRMGKDGVKGFESDGDIFINLDSDTPGLYTATHEIVHVLQDRHPEQWDKLKVSLETLVGKDKYDKWAENKSKQIESVLGKTPSDDVLMRELAASLIEEQAGNESFWKNLNDIDATLVEKILEILKEIKKTIGKVVSGDTAMQKVFGKEMDQAIKAGEDFMSKATQEKKVEVSEKVLPPQSVTLPDVTVQAEKEAITPSKRDIEKPAVTEKTAVKVEPTKAIIKKPKVAGKKSTVKAKILKKEPAVKPVSRDEWIEAHKSRFKVDKATKEIKSVIDVESGKSYPIHPLDRKNGKLTRRKAAILGEIYDKHVKPDVKLSVDTKTLPVSFLRNKANLSDEFGVAIRTIDNSRRTAAEMRSLKKDIKANGIKEPIELYVEKDSKITIIEGTHRLLIAEQLGIKDIPVDIRGDKAKAPMLSLTDDRKQDFKDWMFERYPKISALMEQYPHGVKPTSGNKEDITGSFINWKKDATPIDQAAKFIGIDEDVLLEKINGLQLADLHKIHRNEFKLQAESDRIDAMISDLEDRWDKQAELDKDAPVWLKEAHEVNLKLDELILDINTTASIKSVRGNIEKYAGMVLTEKQTVKKMAEFEDMFKSEDKAGLIKELQNLHYQYIRKKALGKYEDLAIMARKVKKQLMTQRKDTVKTQRLLDNYIRKMLPKEARSKFTGRVVRIGKYKNPETISKHVNEIIQAVDREAEAVLKSSLTKKVRETFFEEIRRMHNAGKKGRKSSIAYDQNAIIIDMIKFYYWGPDGKYDFEKNANKRNIHDMTKNELAKLLLDIESLKQTGRSLKAYQEYETKREIAYQAELGSKDIIKNAPGNYDEYVLNLKRAHDRGHISIGVLAPYEASKNFVSKTNMAVIVPENLIESLSGYDTESPIYKNIWTPMYDSTIAAKGNIEKATNDLNEIMKPLDLDNNGKDIMVKNYLNLNIESPGKKDGKYIRKLTLDELMGMYAHSINDFNRKHLMSTIKSYAPIDDKQADTTIRYALEKFPKKYKDVVDRQIAYYDNVVYPRINEVFRRMHGVDMDKELSYFPIRELYRKGENLLEFLSGEHGLSAKNVKSGFTGKRVGASNPFKSLSYMETVISHMQDVEQMIALSESVWQVRQFLNSDIMTKAMEHKNKNINKILNRWVDDVAYGKFRQPERAAGRVARKLRLNMSKAVLGFNLKTPLKQPISIIQGASMGKSVEVARAMKQYISNPKATWKFIATKDIVMRHRRDSFNLTISQLKESSQFKKMVHAENILPKIQELSFWGIKEMDSFGAGVVWLAKYNEMLKSGASEKKAIREARRVVRLTQPSGDIINLPDAYRRSEVFTWFATFTNQLNKNYSLIGRAIKTHNYKILFGLIMSSVAVQFVNSGFNIFKMWDEPDEFAKMVLNTATGGHPMVGRTVDVLASSIIVAGRKKAGYKVPPWYVNVESSLAPTFIKGPVDLGKTLVRSISAGKLDEKTLDKTISGLMTIFGIPGYYPGSYTFKQIELFKKTGDPRYLVMSKYGIERKFGKKKQGVRFTPSRFSKP